MWSRTLTGYLLIYGNEGAMRSVELLGKEVIPALKEINSTPRIDRTSPTDNGPELINRAVGVPA